MGGYGEQKRASQKVGLKSVNGTPAYMALECFSGETTTATDMWAMGVSLYELLCGNRAVKGDNEIAIYAALLRKDIDYAPLREVGTREEALEFVDALLKRDPTERPSAQDALALAWLADGIETRRERGLSHLDTKRYKKAFSRIRQKSSFSKVFTICSAAQLDTARVHEMNKAFKAMDINGDGMLSQDELRDGLMKMDFDAEMADSIIDSIDVDHDGLVNYSEFIAS